MGNGLCPMMGWLFGTLLASPRNIRLTRMLVEPAE